MTQLIQPDTSINGPAGMCLNYAQKVYHVPHKYDSAWANWLHSIQHADPIPSDVSVPCWFSYFTTIGGVYKNWGHVVVQVPGQGFYSSPYKDRVGHDVLSSIAEVERLYGVKYVGWSEDIADVKVIEGEPMFNEGDRSNMNVYLFKGDRGEFQGQVGKDWKTAMYEIMESNPVKMELYFNGGDSSNVNVYLSGKDQGKYGDAVGKTWKGAMYKIFESPDFKVDQLVNQGDVDNISGMTGWPKENTVNWTHKREVYDYLLPKIQLEHKRPPVTGGIDQATKDQISETNSIVKQIFDKIKGVFK